MKKILFIALSVFMLLTTAVTEGFSSAYDLRQEGYAPAVGNQGSDQTCWTFSALAAIESNYLFRTKVYPYFSNFLGDDSDLSKLHLAWYSFKNSDNKKNFAYVRNGRVISPSDSEILNHAGNPQMALAFLSRHDGPVKESDLPYGGSYPAAGTSPRDYKSVLRVVGAYYIEPLNITLNEGSLDGDLSGDLVIGESDILKLYLMAHGAVSAGIYWDTAYMSSQFAYYNPSSRRGGHAITIIGWDDDYPRENFSPSQPDNNGAWLVQNSWGTSWGNGGCFWMSYEQLLRFAMAFEVEEVNPRIREYYHDDLGFTQAINLSDSADSFAAAANVFKVKGDHEKLREIGFYSTNSVYKADTVILDLGTDNSLENFSERAENIQNLKVLNSFEGLGDRGYIVNLLSEPVALSKDHYFAIAMRMSPKDSSTDFNPTIAAEVQIPNYRTANAEINAQETYFTSDGQTWQDAKYYTFSAGSNEITGFNACIKGFTYVPDERFADDWTVISDDGKAQLSISLLKETAPSAIIATGSGIENILHKVEIENASTGDAKGNFYTLKLIGDLTSDDAKLTSLKINGKEVLTGSVKNIKYATDYLSEDKYLDISKVGISLKEMTQASGVIDSTDGYQENSEETQEDSEKTDEDSRPSTDTTALGGSSSGCNNSEFSLLSLGMLFAVLVLRRKIQ